MHAGARLVIHNRSREVVARLAGEGMQAAASPAEVAHRAPVVILMLSDTPAVEQVCQGADGLINAVRRGSLVIDMGTTAVAATRLIADQFAARGAAFVDAPVSGGDLGAREATLSIMVGGEANAVERAMPLLQVLGRNITRVGSVGAGQVAKTANQIIVGLNIGAVAEALSLARAAGVDPARVRAALSGGFADSRILQVHGQRMIDGDFRPGGKVVTQRKDLRQALELAAAIGLELPATRLNLSLYERLVASGGGELDHSALIKVIAEDDESSG